MAKTSYNNMIDKVINKHVQVEKINFKIPIIQNYIKS